MLALMLIWLTINIYDVNSPLELRAVDSAAVVLELQLMIKQCMKDPVSIDFQIFLIQIFNVKKYVKC